MVHRITHQIKFMDFMRYFQLGENEIKIYNILTKKPVTIKQLQKLSKFSERMLRSHLDDLMKKNFVKKEVIEDGHLKYLYYANQPESICRYIKNMLSEIELKRAKTKKEIIRGSKRFKSKRFPIH